MALGAYVRIKIEGLRNINFLYLFGGDLTFRVVVGIEVGEIRFVEYLMLLGRCLVRFRLKIGLNQF